MKNDKLELSEVEALVSAARTVRVTLPREVAYNLDQFQAVQKDILGKLGCLACCSGFDIRWEFDQRFLVDSKLNVRGF
jgi:hypothetical protein